MNMQNGNASSQRLLINSMDFRQFLFMVPIFGLLLSGSSLSYAQLDTASKSETDRSVVLLKDDQVAVTKDYIEAELEQLPPAQRANFISNPDRVRSLLVNLYVQKKLAREARELGLDTDFMVKKRIEVAADDILAKTRLRMLAEQAEEPDFEALALETYKANPEQYQRPERVRVSHILISTEQRSEEEAKAKAEEVLAQIKQGDKAFDDLAKEYSDDPSAQNNKGDLGFFGKGQMVPTFEEAAFALKNSSDLSGLIKTQFGYHILRLEEREQARKLSFDEVKEQLINNLRLRHKANVNDRYVNQLRTLEGVEINQEAIEALSEAE